MLIAESVQAMQKERRKMTNPEANLQGPTETMPTTNARSIVYCCHNIDIINDPNAATNASSRQVANKTPPLSIFSGHDLLLHEPDCLGCPSLSSNPEASDET